MKISVQLKNKWEPWFLSYVESQGYDGEMLSEASCIFYDYLHCGLAELVSEDDVRAQLSCILSPQWVRNSLRDSERMEEQSLYAIPPVESSLDLETDVANLDWLNGVLTLYREKHGDRKADVAISLLHGALQSELAEKYNVSRNRIWQMSRQFVRFVRRRISVNALYAECCSICDSLRNSQLRELSECGKLQIHSMTF